MSRKAARKAAMKLLFETEFGGEGGRTTLDSMFDGVVFTDDDYTYIQDVTCGVADNKLRIDELISKYSIDWKIERISRVDLSILRLALYEAMFRKDIPQNVLANEAVELAKEFSSPRSSSFINGILGQALKELDDGA